MILFVGPGGGINWNNTQTMVRHNFDFFLKLRGNSLSITTPRKFDSPYEWATFKCLGRCERILPIDIADVDHIQPKTHFQWRVIRTNVSGSECFKAILGFWTILSKGTIFCYDNLSAIGEHKDYYVSDNNMEIAITFRENDIKTYPIQLILENDVTNLQLLCPICNRSKGAQLISHL